MAASVPMPTGANPTKKSAVRFSHQSSHWDLPHWLKFWVRNKKRNSIQQQQTPSCFSQPLLHPCPANPSVSPSLSVVSQGQLEANKHFLARVEDKQTIKRSTPLLFFKQIRKRLGPDLARISFPTVSFQEAVLGVASRTCGE